MTKIKRIVEFEEDDYKKACKTSFSMDGAMPIYKAIRNSKPYEEKPRIATVPIKIKYPDSIVINGYYDKTRKLIFLSSITCELAKQEGFEWKELPEQLRGNLYEISSNN